MNRINHARHAHRGRLSEMAFLPRAKAWNDYQKAKAGGPGRSLSADEIAKIAAERSMKVAGR